MYTLTNEAAGNAVAIFNRAADGTLTAAGTVSTGGLGNGGGLGSQGALTLSQDNQWLFAVNAGSNDISVFAVSAHGLTLADKVASGGEQPISVTSYKNLVYVVNAGGSGNISGFKLGKHGQPDAHCEFDAQPEQQRRGCRARPGADRVQPQW